MKTRLIHVGPLPMGGDAPVSIQTMSKTPLTPQNEAFLQSELETLKSLGCNLVRYAVPSFDAIETLSHLCRLHCLPIVADIHFDYRLALAAVQAGVDKVRINPGNIGDDRKVKEVLKACADAGIPIRVGINGGSLPIAFRSLSRVEGMKAAAEAELNVLEQARFTEAVFSLKSSDPNETLQVNEWFASHYDFPLHVGVTEAGPLIPALVKSTLALSRLLRQSIGNTVRISISGEPAEEVKAAKAILQACGCLPKGATLISCPKCGRATFDPKNILARQIENYLYSVDKKITVAVMGCLVNGPGEAKEADLGITGLGNQVVLFKHGKIIKKVAPEAAFPVITKEIDKL